MKSLKKISWKFFLLSILFSIYSCGNKEKESVPVIKLSENLTLSDENGNELKLNSLTNNRSILFFRIPSQVCMPCLNSEMIYINQLASKFDKKNIVFLTAYPNFRDFLVFKNSTGKDFQCYNIPFLGIELDNKIKEYPYFFVVKKGESEMKGVFVPAKEPSKEYLEIVARKIFDLKIEITK